MTVLPGFSQGIGSYPLSEAQTGLIPITIAELDAEVDFDVESASTITVSVVSTAEGVVASVAGPLGEVVNVSTVSSQGGSAWDFDNTAGSFLMPFPAGYLQVLEFPSFGPGTYKVILDGSGLSEDAVAFIEVASDSTLGLSFITLGSEHPNETDVPLAVAIFDDGQAVLGATVTVEVFDDAQTLAAVVTLRDDGVAPDIAGDDGLYTGLFEPPATGEYRASAAISGLRPGGGGFSRKLYTSFESLDLYGRLTGTFGDSGFDEDNDSLFDSVHLDFDVDVTEPGDYRVLATLETPNGARFFASGTEESMQAGQGSITAPVSITELREIGDPGPYTVVTAKLRYNHPVEGWQPAHLLAALGQTAAYPLSELKPLGVAFTSFSESGIDDDQDGKYDRLSVTLDLEVAVKGTYAGNLSLITSTGNVISTVENSFYLHEGSESATIDFFGPDIRSYGADGPYLLRSLRIEGKSDLLTVAEVGTTQGYLATDFDSLSPGIVAIDPPEVFAGGAAEVLVDVNEMELPFDEVGVSFDFGPDITVTGIEVLFETRARVEIDVSPTATDGPRAVSVTSGSTTASLLDEYGFWVYPPSDEETLLSVSPAVGQQGETVTVTIEGDGTTFSDPMTVWLGEEYWEGAEATSVTVVDSDTATATFEIHPTTRPGFYTVSADYGTTFASLENAFEVQIVPQLWTVYPGIGNPSQTLEVVLIGQGTSFSQVNTSLDFGAGVTVTAMNVLQDDTIEATVVIDPSAAFGVRDVTATTGPQVVTKVDGFRVNAPPTLTNPGDKTDVAGEVVNVPLVATDPEGQSVTFSATGLPAGLYINDVWVAFAGTAGEVGTFNVSLTATDSLGSSSTESFVWTIEAPEEPFVLYVGNQTNEIGKPVSLQIVAAAPESSSLTYSATGLPDGLTIDSETGLITGVPTTIAQFLASVTATDNAQNSDTVTFYWQIVTAASPTLTDPASQTNVVGDTVSLQLVATDPNSDPLTYSATGLPDGLTIGASTGLIAGTLTTAGSFSVTAVVDDGNSGQDSKAFAWTITVPGAPTLTNPGAQTDFVGDTVSLQLVASDPDSDPLTYDATGLPDGLAISTSTGLITGTPTTAGPYSVNATVSDGNGGVDAESFSWTIEVPNSAPTLTNPGSQTNDVGDTVSLQLSAADPESDTLTYGATGLPAGLTINTTTGLITGTPTTAGSYSVDATVNDGNGGTDAESFSWTIDDPNGAPTLTNPGNHSSTIGDTVSLQISATDPESDPLTYGAMDLPAGLSINTATGLITGTPTTAGSYSVNATVSDGNGGTDEEAFSWTVNAVGAPQVFTAYQVAAGLEGNQSYSGTIGMEFNVVSAVEVTELGAFDSDGDGLARTITVRVWNRSSTGTPVSELVFAPGDGTLEGGSRFKPLATPLVLPAGFQGLVTATGFGAEELNFNANGTAHPSLTRNDGSGLLSFGDSRWGSGAGYPGGVVTTQQGYASGTLKYGASSSPTLTNPGPQTNTVGDAVSLQLSASDPNNDPLTYGATGLPVGLSINTATGLISGTATTAGTFSGEASVDDGNGGTDMEAFSWTVNAVGAPQV